MRRARHGSRDARSRPIRDARRTARALEGLDGQVRRERAGVAGRPEGRLARRHGAQLPGVVPERSAFRSARRSDDRALSRPAWGSSTSAPTGSRRNSSPRWRSRSPKARLNSWRTSTPTTMPWPAPRPTARRTRPIGSSSRPRGRSKRPRQRVAPLERRGVPHERLRDRLDERGRPRRRARLAHEPGRRGGEQDGHHGGHPDPLDRGLTALGDRRHGARLGAAPRTDPPRVANERRAER